MITGQEIGHMYRESLWWSIAACIISRLISAWGQDKVNKAPAGGEASRSKEFRAFQRTFLFVALLAIFSDWVQGPYGYALYASYGYDQGQIAMLYMGGFLSSMLAGSYVGALADRYGRRRMCVLYAIFYAVSCLVKLINHYYILMLGRFFAGIATSLLFSSFEAWMVCEHQRRAFDAELLPLTFGYFTLGNGLVAVVAGLIANALADQYGFVGPFMFCLGPLALVAVTAMLWWPENYGDHNSKAEWALNKAWMYIKSNPAVLYLGLAQSCFEGAMYAFVFIWTPALQVSGEDVGPHLGVIFSVFMVCSMIGANLFGLLLSRNALLTTPILVHTMATLVNLAACLLIQQTTSVYLSFLLFEVTVGMFYPSYGSIRSLNIPEEVRSAVMNIFRIPLNGIMVVLLALIELKEITIGTTLALCTTIHGLGLLSYLAFKQRARSKVTSLGEYALVNIDRVYSEREQDA